MDYQHTCQLIPVVHVNTICTIHKRHKNNKRKGQLRQSMMTEGCECTREKKPLACRNIHLVMRHNQKSSHLIFRLRLPHWQLENYLFTSKQFTSDWKSPRDKNLVSKIAVFVFFFNDVTFQGKL